MKTRPTEIDAAGQSRRPDGESDGWRTALTHIEPNKILVRGYALDPQHAEALWAKSEEWVGERF